MVATKEIFQLNILNTESGPILQIASWLCKSVLPHIETPVTNAILLFYYYNSTALSLTRSDVFMLEVPDPSCFLLVFFEGLNIKVLVRNNMRQFIPVLIH